MTIYGYARVSTDDQSCEIQVDKLTAGGAELIRSENVSGTSLEGRTELRNLMDFVRQGDTLLITRIDRLSRSIKDVQNIVSELDEKGVILRATEQPIDTISARPP
jgi:DNA invertase Pin-like site-specific DNA recombinase